MRTVILLLILASSLCSQEYNYYYYFSDGPVYDPDAAVTLYAPSRWTDTTMQLSPYQSAYVYTKQKILKTGHDDFLDQTMGSCDSFYLEFRWRLKTPSGGQRLLGVGNMIFLYAQGNAGHLDVTFKNDGNWYKVYADDGSDTSTIKTIKLIWHKSDSICYTYKDGVLQYTHTGITLKTTFMASNLASLVLNNISITQTVTDGTYETAEITNSGNTSWYYVSYKRNDTLRVYNMNSGSQLFIHPRTYVGGVEIFPYRTFAYYDRPSTSPAILQNGVTSNIDTLDGTFIFGSVKANYRDCFIPVKEISSWIPSPYFIHSEGFGGEPIVLNDTLYVGGNYNIANGTGKTRAGYDSLKSAGRYNPGTGSWEQLGYGMTTATGTSGCMHIGIYGDSIIATGYDRTATGVGTINGVAIRRSGQSNWAPMGSGLGANGVGFGGGQGYGCYLLVGSFTRSGGASGEYAQLWNGTSWDSTRGGLDGIPYAVQAFTWNGERGWLVGGEYLNFTQGGVTTPCSGLSFYSYDSLKWKKFYDMQTAGTPYTVFNIMIDGDWIYFVGNFIQLGTATSRGIIRYKIGIGAQNIGTGIGSVVNAEAITSICKIGDIIYIAGSFTWFNGFLNRNLAGFNIRTGAIKDMGYGLPMRPEGLCKYYSSSVASDTILVILGDNLEANGKLQRIVAFYDPSLNP